MPATILKYLAMKSTTALLRRLIIESSLPLSNVETVFAIDSTGLATSRCVRWIDHRYGKSKVRDMRSWIKVHIMCGVLTNIITAVEITGPTTADSLYFKVLLLTTLRHFRVREVLCDKAYSAFATLHFAHRRIDCFAPRHRIRHEVWNFGR